MKTTDAGGPRGYDAGKKVMGRKRHAMVDTDGRPLESFKINGSPLVAAVPETATWVMMILGFGAIGGMMRRAHRKSEEHFTSQVRAIAAA